MLEGTLPHLCQHFGNMDNKGRFVPLSTARNRGEEGRVCFNEKPVLRNNLRHLSQQVRVLERDNPAKTDAETQVHDPHCLVWPAGERMNNPGVAFPTASRGTELTEDFHRINIRFPAVRDHGQVKNRGKFELPGKKSFLGFGRIGMVVIVQSYLANPHYTRPACLLFPYSPFQCLHKFTRRSRTSLVTVTSQHNSCHGRPPVSGIKGGRIRPGISPYREHAQDTLVPRAKHRCFIHVIEMNVCIKEVHFCHP